MSRCDYTFEETEELENLKRLILSNFETRGYRQIHLSAFESIETFVEQKGETVRQKIFTLNADAGDSGSDLCLRPELTVPACKFYLNSLADSMDYGRLCYEGLVWRMNPVEQGFYSEFTQAGIELIGNYCEIGADAEVLELAIDTLSRCDVAMSNIVVNDVRILKHVFAELGIGQKLQSQIEQVLIRGGQLSQLVNSQPSPAANSDLFDQVLELVGPEKLSEFLVEILALQGYSQGHNARTPEDVADRFIRKKTGEANELTSRQLDLLTELLAISGEVDRVASRLRSFAKNHDFRELKKFQECVAMLPRKTRLLSSALPENQLPPIEWNLGFLRSFKYYSGLIFDINSNSGAVCGGGRYDTLFTQIGAPNALQAAGFAIGVDRLLHERPSSSGRKQKSMAIVAMLQSDAPTTDQELETGNQLNRYHHCFAVAKQVRSLNWVAETDFSGASRAELISKSKRAGAAILMLIGDEQVDNRAVTIRRLPENVEETIPVSQLKKFLNQSGQPAGEV